MLQYECSLVLNMCYFIVIFTQKVISFDDRTLLICQVIFLMNDTTINGHGWSDLWWYEWEYSEDEVFEWRLVLVEAEQEVVAFADGG